MGEVYAAVHRLTGHAVALKVVRRTNEEARRRLLREAKAAGMLKDQHTARILDADTLATGEPFLVYELLEGQDLASLLHARGRLPFELVRRLVVQASRALTEAHRLGIVHRDIKPANLFLLAGEEPHVKVLDFGIAKLAHESDAGVTSTGSVLGSPRYMSPEQVRDPKRVDWRTDQWSLAVTLHELATGHAPFENDHAPALCAMIASEPPTLRVRATPGLPDGLDAVLLRCLRKAPSERFESVEAFAEALLALDGAGVVDAAPTAREHLDGDTLDTQANTQLSVEEKPKRARSTRTLFGALALALVGTGLSVLALGRQERTGPNLASTGAPVDEADSVAPELDRPAQISSGATNEAAPAVSFSVASAEVRQSPPARPLPATSVRLRPAASTKSEAEVLQDR